METNYAKAHKILFSYNEVIFSLNFNYNMFPFVLLFNFVELEIYKKLVDKTDAFPF